MPRVARHHLLSRMAWLAVALAFAAAVALWINRTDPSRIPQEELYLLGTRSDNAWMTPLPQRHPVLIAPLGPAFLVELARESVPAVIGMKGFAEQGLFDPRTGNIYISGSFVRLQAAMPVVGLQPAFRRVLRHEYGHALLYDWLRREGGESARTLIPFTTTAAARDPDEYPPALRPLVEEYLRQPDDLYGHPYFTSTFSEYFAESYALFLDGREVPEQIRRFLEGLAAPANHA